MWVLLFKQKTAYEMRISDWSSDVCSSDLAGEGGRGQQRGQAGQGRLHRLEFPWTDADDDNRCGPAPAHPRVAPSCRSGRPDGSLRALPTCRHATMSFRTQMRPAFIPPSVTRQVNLPAPANPPYSSEEPRVGKGVVSTGRTPRYPTQ